MVETDIFSELTALADHVSETAPETGGVFDDRGGDVGIRGGTDGVAEPVVVPAPPRPAFVQAGLADDLLPARVRRPGGEPDDEARGSDAIFDALRSDPIDDLDLSPATSPEDFWKGSHRTAEPEVTAATPETLATRIGKRLHDRAVILNDVAIPRSGANIDHIVVAPSGVWVVDTKAYGGRVERRAAGEHGESSLYVKGRESANLVLGMTTQVGAVFDALDGVTLGPVHPVLCFTDSEWKVGAKAFSIDGVFVVWPKRLVKMINRRGPFTDEDIAVVVRRLTERLS